MFDLGHQAYRLFVKGGIFKGLQTPQQIEEQKVQQSLSSCKDTWFFDMGQNIAFTQIIYCTILIFSQVAPLITPFGCLFFTFKYLIDKYNILYVYPNEYVGQGRLYKRIIKMQYFGIATSQLIMFGILIAIFSRAYVYQCAFIVVCQIIFLSFY